MKMENNEGIKLQKYISDCGLMSRRKAEAEIENGAFTINGEPAVLGNRVFPGKDVVEYRGEQVAPQSRKYYVMLNKPQGYVTTTADELGRKNVCSLVDLPARLYPVGRLDYNSEGLLLLTNDGEFANRMTHPRYEHKKRYLVTVAGRIENNALDMIQHLRELDGEPINPVEVKLAERNENASKLIFTLTEGKNREIRRICEKAGLSIMQLKRFALGPLQLGELAPGSWRHLTPEEIKELKNTDDNHKTKGIFKKAGPNDRRPLSDRQKRDNRNDSRNARRRADGKGADKDNPAGNFAGKPQRRNGRTDG